MAFSYSPKIVTNGLVLYLDAANPTSYVSGSLNWNDISRGGNNGTLVNGPTFNTGSGGSIVFDGTNNYVSGSSSISLSNNFTLQIAINPSTQAVGTYKEIASFQQLYSSNLGWYVGIDNRPAASVANTVFISIGSDSSYLYSAQNTVVTNGINKFIISFVCTGGVLSVYVNGVQTAGLSSNNTSRTINYSGNDFFIGKSTGTGRYAGSWYSYLLYNRALSANEILQNYNATKGRFGLT